MEMECFWYECMNWYGLVGIGIGCGIVGFCNWY